MKKIEQEDKGKWVERFGFFFGNGVTYRYRDDGLCSNKPKNGFGSPVKCGDRKEKTAK